MGQDLHKTPGPVFFMTAEHLHMIHSAVFNIKPLFTEQIICFPTL